MAGVTLLKSNTYSLQIMCFSMHRIVQTCLWIPSSLGVCITKRPVQVFHSDHQNTSTWRRFLQSKQTKLSESTAYSIKWNNSTKICVLICALHAVLSKTEPSLPTKWICSVSKCFVVFHSVSWQGAFSINTTKCMCHQPVWTKQCKLVHNCCCKMGLKEQQ